MFSLASALSRSGILAECSGRLSEAVPHSYYGYNVSKSDREPIDQIHGFIGAARIAQHWSLTMPGRELPTFFPFVAGRFEVLNTTSELELVEIDEINSVKEKRKYALFLRIAEAFKLTCNVLVTDDLLADPIYWEIVGELLDSGQFSRKSLTADTLKWYSSPSEIDRYLPVSTVAADRFALAPRLLKKIGNWPAPLLYTPMEVAEAVYLQRQHGVQCKLGHMEETVYDKYILTYMDIVHLRQPSDLKSRLLKPRTVTPYIDKARRDPKIRIFFDDDDVSITARIEEAGVDLSYVRTLSAVAGEILNPLLDKAVLAVESACAQGGEARIGGYDFESGASLITAVSDGWITLQEILDSLPDIVTRWMIEPFRVEA